MAAASEMGKGQTKAHPGFTAVAAKIGKRSGIKNPAAVLAAATRKAGSAARKKNPRLNRIKGKPSS